jgi:phosphoglycerol geranylgeranyltransferase
MTQQNHIYQRFLRGDKKKLSILIDPDKTTHHELVKMAGICQHAGVDYVFLGGSLLTRDMFDNSIRILKENCDKPVVLFPGSTLQISSHADAILFLSLISGRNPEMLIGKHVIAAPLLKEIGLEVIPTGYMLIDGGTRTTVEYISNTLPIPANKPEIAAATAIAGEMLGLKLIYMDAGSGATTPISKKFVQKVKENISIPLIVGGGIRNTEDATNAYNAGADMIVVGNILEKSPELAFEFAEIAARS